jgi:hypothetical protein
VETQIYSRSKLPPGPSLERRARPIDQRRIPAGSGHLKLAPHRR